MSLTRKSYPRNDLTGKKFGMLTPVEWLKGGKWRCICDCGNETIVDTRNLTNGRTTSCGCKRYLSKNVVDMTGYEDDNIKVIDRDGNVGEIAAWKCVCKHCGRIFTTKGSNIRFGYTQSCGCIHSKNEQKIISLLTDNHVEFSAQYTFPDLIGVGGRKLRFDFAIFENKKLKRLIEFNGAQHYICPQGSWSKGYNALIANDALKVAYCKQHNIDLKIITYKDDYDINDLLYY